MEPFTIRRLLRRPVDDLTTAPPAHPFRRLRFLLIGSLALSLLSLVAGLSFHAFQLKDNLLNQLYGESDIQTQAAMIEIESSLLSYQRSVQSLAGDPDIIRALSQPDSASLLGANRILDLLRASQELDVVYLLDPAGIGLASSNRDDGDSFVGGDYGFRPYFQQARRGQPSIYMALGVTSGERGIYYAYPVGGRGADPFLGVAVIKVSMASLERKLPHTPGGMIALIDPQGIVFMSNRPDWVLHALWEIPAEAQEEIRASHQFGSGPWPWLGFVEQSAGQALDAAGDSYVVRSQALQFAPGWRLLYLFDPALITRMVSAPLLSISRVFILAITSILILTSVLFYRIANRELERRMASERRQEDHRRRLEEEVASRKRSEELQLAENEKLRILNYAFSHDLKTPLRGIAGYAAELERKHGDQLSERAEFCISQILAATRRLDQMIEDLLLYSRLDAEPPSIAPVDLQRLTGSILGSLRHTIDEQGAQVSLEIPPDAILHTWERGLRQVIAALLENALKFSRLSESPRILLRLERQEPLWRLSIRDNGIGFDMRYHERIYGLFNRLGRMEEYEGSGVGLTLARVVLDKIEGRIWAESSPGEGTTFFVELRDFS